MKRIFSILFALVLAVSLMLVPAASVGASPGPGIVGLWHFDEGSGTIAYDSSGNSNNGTLTNGPIWVDGKFGNALDFDGTNDYVNVPHDTTLNPTSAITVECWAKLNHVDDHQVLVRKMNTYSLQVTVGLNGAGARLEGWVMIGGAWKGVRGVSGALSLAANQWYHFAFTYDGAQVITYVNGVADRSNTVTGAINSTTNPLNIGRCGPEDISGEHGYTDGLIDEVRIWDVAVNPVTVSLRAGQHMDVGTVTVWNDSTKLYAEYQTSDGWCLTETHLHVATSMDAIPQRNGNPVPGKFDYKTEHDCATAYTYTIPLNWDPCTYLYIAAHAEVQKLSDVMTASLASGDDTDSVLVIAEDADNPGYPIGYPESYGGNPTSSVVIQGTEAAYSGWPTITGAQWISDSLENPGIVNSWRLFTTNFSIPSNATNISGTLQIDSDNAEEAKINGSPADAFVYGEVYGPFTDNQEWGWVSSWPVGSYLQPGPNTLEVMVRNYYWEPTPGMWNYTGLIYKMDYEYQLLFTETAWGDGEDFPGKNWATYFQYHIQ